MDSLPNQLGYLLMDDDGAIIAVITFQIYLIILYFWLFAIQCSSQLLDIITTLVRTSK